MRGIIPHVDARSGALDVCDQSGCTSAFCRPHAVHRRRWPTSHSLVLSLAPLRLQSLEGQRSAMMTQRCQAPCVDAINAVAPVMG